MFGVTDYGSFVLAFILLLLIPGPGNLALITSTSKGGLRAGIAATFGAILGDQVLMWLAVAGVAAILQSHPAAFHAVQWLGAAYLMWLGASLLLAKPGAALVLEIKPRHYLRQSATIALLNPKTIVFYMAFFPLFIDPTSNPGFSTFAFMGATVASLTLIYGTIVVLLTGFFASRLRANATASRVMQKLAGMFLVGFGLKLAALRAA
ncbi:LysE family transporter [Pseudomonas sp. SDO524_S393]